MEDRKLALREVKILKRAFEMPGVFGGRQPYGMTAGVRKTLGVVGKSQRGLPGMVGTIGEGKGTGTITGVPKGMGKNEANAAPTAMSGKMGSAIAPAPSIKPFGGFPTVKPDMHISAKPTPAKPESIRLARARLKFAWVSEALRAAGGMGSRMLRNKAFWGAAAAGGTAYGMSKLFRGAANLAQDHRDRIQSVTPGGAPPMGNQPQ